MRRTTSPYRVLIVLLSVLFLLIFSGTGTAEASCSNSANCITILHTNDMHSRFLAPPNADYSPDTTGDDDTIGGIARIATKVEEIRAARAPDGIPVLLLDGGDFTMGSLFHLMVGEAEMGMMNHLGYDATTIGNHEFDLLPTGAADIVSHRGSIRVLATNLEVLDEYDPWGAAIKARMDAGDILETAVQILDNGIKVGYFGILGDGAWEDTNKPYGEAEYPLGIQDRFTAASEAVSHLRDTEEVDIVICLSHSGVDDEDPSQGEDPELALEVPGIDVIISGHTHTLIPDPVIEGDTIIVQAKAYTERLGVLDLELDSGTWSVLSYDCVVIDDSIPGDAVTQALVEDYIDDIDTNILGPMGYSFSDPIAETDFDLTKDYAVEHNIGNLVTDAIRWSIEEATGEPIDVAAESNGVIRDDILEGTTGVIQTSDAFRVVSLGIDVVSEQIGYPLITFCLNGEDLYNVAWINALAPLLQSLVSSYTDYWISWSGIGFQYINNLPPRKMWQCNDFSDPDCVDRTPIRNNKSQLYNVAVNYYMATNIYRLEDVSYGLIKVVPKDCETGDPVTDLTDAIVYEDVDDPLMQWEGFLDYLASFEDTDEDGIPNIPDRYAGKEDRMIKLCVVATAAYGSPFEEKVGVLRDLRDEILEKSPMGRKFVDFYYAHGPDLAERVAECGWLRALVRILLLPLVGVAKFLLWVV